MITTLEQVQRTNSGSATGWMTEIESTDADQVRSRLQQKLATVPAEAARVSGPRNVTDISHAIWERIKHKIGVDFEQPLNLTQWR